MSHLGKKIKLTGISQKGKNRVRDHGEIWSVLAETPTVLFAPHMQGPFLFIAPLGKGQDDKASRWIKMNGDPDFIFVEI
jgi:hypothetical protein